MPFQRLDATHARPLIAMAGSFGRSESHMCRIPRRFYQCLWKSRNLACSRQYLEQGTSIRTLILRGGSCDNAAHNSDPTRVPCRERVWTDVADNIQREKKVAFLAWIPTPIHAHLAREDGPWRFYQGNCSKCRPIGHLASGIPELWHWSCWAILGFRESW